MHSGRGIGPRRGCGTGLDFDPISADQFLHFSQERNTLFSAPQALKPAGGPASHTRVRLWNTRVCVRERERCPQDGQGTPTVSGTVLGRELGQVVQRLC